MKVKMLNMEKSNSDSLKRHSRDKLLKTVMLVTALKWNLLTHTCLRMQSEYLRMEAISLHDKNPVLNLLFKALWTFMSTLWDTMLPFTQPNVCSIRSLWISPTTHLNSIITKHCSQCHSAKVKWHMQEQSWTRCKYELAEENSNVYFVVKGWSVIKKIITLKKVKSLC